MKRIPKNDAHTLTHRCPDCPAEAEHLESELCGACGRCEDHCHHSAACED